ncbi:membrane-spanning 4-domains subfamily A member 15-like [Sphaeramia orbicularis]|uniref:Membrane-spanning 4-domains subfamily A member 15-like n=1 Tax=Sphaeramia orbicularis TaxID=375764 RepID=A0A673A2M9_9TELE|nr:membrane-spanning 4-domains subfamily A member 15-like [Sphaeramia orbicularis]XP_030014066.1 membrane-spanning 4-domains subfamily A member 15-like [Sphaeramia orbicularis]
MSVTMAKADGVTVFTLTSDPNSACPPLCQMFKGLCYSPVCCSVSQPLRRLQGTSQSVLGALQVMVGILNIGFGTILFICLDDSWWAPVFPFWLGSLFIFFGIMCILSEKFPSPCLVIFNVILNLIGIGFSITAIALYIFYLDIPWWYNFSPCGTRYWGYSSRYSTMATESPELQIMIKKCEEGQHLIMMLMKSIYILLIILSVLELCITISSVVLGIKALRKRGKEQNKSSEVPEHYKELLEDATTNATV